MGGGAWWAAVHGVAKSRTRLSDFTFTFHFPALEKEIATHSSVLAWKIPGTAEPGGLPSMGSHRVGHDWSDLAAATYHKHRNRKIFFSFLFLRAFERLIAGWTSWGKRKRTHKANRAVHIRAQRYMGSRAGAMKEKMATHDLGNQRKMDNFV